LVDIFNVETMAMVSLLTNGRSWVLLQKQLVNGKGGLSWGNDTCIILLHAIDDIRAICDSKNVLVRVSVLLPIITSDNNAQVFLFSLMT